MSMTPEAKSQLAKTIGALRKELVEALDASVKSTYRWGMPADGLDEGLLARRKRLEAWVNEQAADDRRTPTAYLLALLEQAAATHLHRHVMLRMLEATPARGKALRPTPVLTGGKRSRGYLDFRALAPALIDDPSEGYELLLGYVFEDLALELPGVFGSVGIVDLVPLSVAMHEALVKALDATELVSCWTDDMTLGWVYQYWNDPARNILDDKLDEGGKIAPHELASKTQLFTERYMVDWILQNSLGPIWRDLCARNGWTMEVEADGTLERLADRRAAWRAKRDAGEVTLTDEMPLHTDAERRWVYFLDTNGEGEAGEGGIDDSSPQDRPRRAPPQDPGAPPALASIRDLRMIDPAVGSGHFLVVAMDHLFALHKEEARHRGLAQHPDWSDRAIVAHILGHNLHGIDLDPRAVQIAAAALWLKAQQLAPGAVVSTLNVVASSFGLKHVADNMAGAVRSLRDELMLEAGIPEKLTNRILGALHEADHMGSLLRADRAVDDVIADAEGNFRRGDDREQGDLFAGYAERVRTPIPLEEVRATLVGRIEAFLTRHTGGDDLGLRLRGEQLSAGVRYLRMLREGSYDLVVANPPYLGTAKMQDARAVAGAYPRAKADLYAAFLERGLQLVREGGTSAMLTMRGWMFIKQFKDLRTWLLEHHDLRALGDYDTGAFAEIGGDVVTVTSSIFRRGRSAGARGPAVAQRMVEGGVARKRADGLAGAGVHCFDLDALKVVPAWPLVYWWSDDERAAYRRHPRMGQVSPARTGMKTGNNVRFLRAPWEITPFDWVSLLTTHTDPSPMARRWVPYVKGAAGNAWLEPMQEVLPWNENSVALRLYGGSTIGHKETYYFRPAVAYTTIGTNFTARAYRYRSAFDIGGASVFNADIAATTALLNSTRARKVLQSLNPTVNFQPGDVNRVPLFPIAGAKEIFATLEAAFGVHESHREPSVEFQQPGPSPWAHAQAWAQAAVDRPEGAPLPAYVECLDAEPAWHHLSYALGVALGRFHPAGRGVLDPATADLTHALPQGILVLDGTLDAHATQGDDLSHPACASLRAAWDAHRSALGTARTSLREWLRRDFFTHHKGMYDNRPVHWPLASRDKTFVAWVNIHRMDARTLDEVQVRFLTAEKRLDQQRRDLDLARSASDARRKPEAEQAFARVSAQLDELRAFMTTLAQCASKGPPEVTIGKQSSLPPEEHGVVGVLTYDPVLDDGVMVNSAALWPLLDPLWKDPKKVWVELSRAGAKDYDWSEIARTYWPERVDNKCQGDASLAVAHGCVWRYHPAKAWVWELRLQDEIGPGFRIEEGPYRATPRAVASPDSTALRADWLAAHPREALDAVLKEALRRASKGRFAGVENRAEMRLLEPGLWRSDPRRCWDIELEVSEKLGVELFLLTPDEAEARAAWTDAHADHVAARRRRVAQLVPRVLSSAAVDDDGGDGDDEGAEG